MVETSIQQRKGHIKFICDQSHIKLLQDLRHSRAHKSGSPAFNSVGFSNSSPYCKCLLSGGCVSRRSLWSHVHGFMSLVRCASASVLFNLIDAEPHPQKLISRTRGSLGRRLPSPRTPSRAFRAPTVPATYPPKKCFHAHASAAVAPAAEAAALAAALHFEPRIEKTAPCRR
jgi:hypothetical protein